MSYRLEGHWCGYLNGPLSVSWTATVWGASIGWEG